MDRESALALKDFNKAYDAFRAASTVIGRSLDQQATHAEASSIRADRANDNWLDTALKATGLKQDTLSTLTLDFRYQAEAMHWKSQSYEPMAESVRHMLTHPGEKIEYLPHGLANFIHSLDNATGGDLITDADSKLLMDRLKDQVDAMPEVTDFDKGRKAFMTRKLAVPQDNGLLEVPSAVGRTTWAHTGQHTDSAKGNGMPVFASPQP